MDDKHSANKKGGGLNNKAFAAVAVMTFLGMYAFTMTTSAVIAEKDIASKAQRYLLENYAYNEAIENEEDLAVISAVNEGLEDAINSPDIKFTSSVQGKCFPKDAALLDNFDQSPKDASGMNINKYDSDIWTVYASNNSTFTTQDSKGKFFATGRTDNKNAGGVIISTKDLITGNFNASLLDVNMPNNLDLDGSSSVVKFSLWQKDGTSAGIILTKNRENQKYASFFTYDPVTKRTNYSNAEGKSSTSFSRVKKGIASGPATLRFYRNNRQMVAYVTVNSKELQVGPYGIFNAFDGYLTVSYSILGQSRTTVADAQGVRFEGCFK